MKNNLTRLLILGVTGMLGSTLFRYFSSKPNFEVFGTMRSKSGINFFDENLRSNLYSDIDVENYKSLQSVFNQYRPNIVLNCVGIVKQLDEADNPLVAIPINSLLPHQLARLCKDIDSRLIHFSTDCIFSGAKGMYREEDFPDANDLYGRSKFLGEVANEFHVLTLRTSIIGHELSGSRSLVNWFLSQNDSIKGFSKAVFSGLPTVEIARILDELVFRNPSLYGVYHVSGLPINKFDLLTLIAKTYNKKVVINSDDSFVIDRSLDSSRFMNATGYVQHKWPQLIQKMHQFS